MAIAILVVTVLVGLYMAWNIGANDVANSMAAAVGSKSISVKKAIIAAGICEFAGAVLVGAHVTDTVRKGIFRADDGQVCADFFCIIGNRIRIVDIANQKFIAQFSNTGIQIGSEAVNKFLLR